MEGYKKHLKMHRLDELFRSMPGAEDVATDCWNEFPYIFSSIINVEGDLPLTTETKPIARHLSAISDLKSCTFLSEVVNTIVEECLRGCSLSTLASFDGSFKKKVQELLASATRRFNFLQVLKDSVPFEFSDGAGHWIVADIFRKISSKVEAYVLRSLREPYEQKVFSTGCEGIARDDPDDISFQQTIYYIGGSTIQSVVKLGLRSNSPVWQNVIKCVQRKMLVGELVEAPSAEVVLWTESVNRGGLKFISEPVWSFFMALSGVLTQMEGNDGSVLHESVKSAVRGDEILMMMWSDLVGDSLCEEDSQFLLTQVCNYFTNTWGAGIVLRRKNKIVDQCKDKNPLRASLLTLN